MDNAAPLPVRKKLADYTPPAWTVPQTHLHFALDAERTVVKALLQVVRQGDSNAPLHLDAEELELLEVRVNGQVRPLPNIGPHGFDLLIEGDEAIVETTVAIAPAANSRLMGLYSSGGNLCTQCEAEGFRRITPFPDRPDVLSRYSVRMEADKALYPALLSNGNPDAAGNLPDGRHFAEWTDPFPKPSYLFALVAGQLAVLEDSFTTRSGREVKLGIWVASADIPRCHHAMESLKQSMAWDEDVYGREYDLDRFNLVAVHDFNFGAMENKGLNIFNAKYVLADPDTATDWDYDAIAGIVAHEYFHNWSGNRVTCRDWFQLSLKEGFTVYRDQQFSADIGSAAVKRIESVRQLRAAQFAEDAGPLAHPVRPDSYMEISNFYTATVYDKGAELIRMQAGLLGKESFRRATDRYFDANDGTAATVEDFLAAMATEGLDAERFRRWYEQPGTPVVEVQSDYDAATQRLVLTIRQSNPRAPSGAAPLPTPFRYAAFAKEGTRLFAEDDLVLTEVETVRTYEGIAEKPILSLNRGFAAPILARPAPERADLLILAAHEDDSFSRYEAVQQLMLSALTQSARSGHSVGYDEVAQAARTLLENWAQDPAFTAETLLIPSEAFIGDQMEAVNPEAIHTAREALRRHLAETLGNEMTAIWTDTETTASDLTPRAKGLRRLRGILLSLLMSRDTPEAVELAYRQFSAAKGMTDRLSALQALITSASDQRDRALEVFYERYSTLPEVLDKWFLAQAASTRADTREQVQKLMGHPQFDARNPNRLRALVLGFATNQARFHDREGAGYALLADQVLKTDRINPQSAARLVQPLTRWRRLAEPWRSKMKAELERVASHPSLSRDLTEVSSTGLK